MKFILGLITILLLTSGDRPPPHWRERSDDAYVLAIEFFDPLHEVGIQFDGPEHSYIQCALGECIEILPQLEPVHILMTSQDPGAFELTAINSVHFTANPSQSQWLRDTAEIIGSGWFIRRSEDRVGYAAEKTIRVNTIWSFPRLDQNSEHSQGDWLLELGFNSMILNELPESGFATLVFRSAPSDINLTLEQLHADSTYSQIFGERRFKRFGELRPASGPTDIRLTDMAAKHTLADPVSLEFTCRWGDRPSSISKSHVWTIVCRPLNRVDGKNWQFDAVVASEQGEEVPDNLWIKMGCGRRLAY